MLLSKDFSYFPDKSLKVLINRMKPIMISSNKIQKSNRIKRITTVDFEFDRNIIQSSFHKNTLLIEEILSVLLSFEERVSLFGNLKVF